MNKTIETLLNRGSLRTYKNEKVSKEHLDIVLQCAMRAPTAGNMMTYSIIVIENQELKDKLAVSCDNQPFIAKSPVLLVFLADLNKWYKYYENNNIKDFLKEKDEVFKGPASSNLFLAMQDAVIAAENAVVAAQSLGMGTCYIGDIMEKIEYHKELLNLPKYVYPVTMLTLGYYPDNYSIPLRDRFNREYVVFNETYKELSDEEVSSMFKNRDKLYVEKNKYGAKNYAQMHYSFKTKSAFAEEMTRSANEVLKEWNEEVIE